MFCKDCGVQFTAAYCAKCGIAKPSDLRPASISPSRSKFCSGCGKPTGAAYCGGCGKPRRVEVTFSQVGAEGHRMGSFSIKALGLHGLLMGVVFLLALSAMPLWLGAMLAVAAIPGVLVSFVPGFYNKFKIPINLAAMAIGITCAVMGAIQGVMRLHYIGLVLCILGFLAIGFMAFSGKLPIPTPVAKCITALESGMYFYVATLYFAISTVFLRSNYAVDLFFDEVIIDRLIDGGSIMLLLLYTLVMLAPPIALAYAHFKRNTKIFAISMVLFVTSTLAALPIILLYFLRDYDFPLGYIIAGLTGVLLSGYIIFTNRATLVQFITGRE